MNEKQQKALDIVMENKRLGRKSRKGEHLRKAIWPAKSIVNELANGLINSEEAKEDLNRILPRLAKTAAQAEDDGVSNQATRTLLEAVKTLTAVQAAEEGGASAASQPIQVNFTFNSLPPPQEAQVLDVPSRELADEPAPDESE